MKKKSQTYLFLCFTFFVVNVFGYSVDSEGIVKPMQPPRLVNDFAGILNSTQQQQLERKLLSFNDSTSTQIYIVTIDSLNDYAIEDYALRLGRNWAIGKKDINNGVLILLSESDRSADIEIGYGLESYITDYDARHIIQEQIVPAFQKGNYFEGLDNATDRIIVLSQGDFKNEITEDEPSPISVFWIILFVILIIYLMYKFPILGRIAYVVLSSGGSIGGSRSSRGGFGGGGGGSFGGGGSSGKW